ncbi:hypothetical protein ACHAPE_002374 [Trichoderma viride]
MATKREIEDQDGYSPEPQTKRAKTHGSKTRQHQNSGIDPTWGQKYVFSSRKDATTIPEGEESDFEDDSDAMAYLMSVRQEASTIPHLLVAPKVQIGPQLPPEFDVEADDDSDEEEGEIDQGFDAHDTPAAPDSKGFYEDGAYIGISKGWGDDNVEQGQDPDEEDPAVIQKALNEAYYASILGLYRRTREILDSKLPDNAASRLSASQATEAAPFGRHSPTTRLWTRLLQTTDPHPIQVALMSKDSIIRILRVLIGGKFLRSGHSIPQRTSQWLWALLARLPELGELNHTEVGWIRDLGRRAVLLGRSLSEMAALRDELADDGFGVNDNVDASSSDEEVVAEVAEEGEEVEEEDGDEEHDTLPATENKTAENAVLNSSSPAPIVIPQDENEVPTGKGDEDEDDGEIKETNDDSEDEDVAMDIASDSDADEGEIVEQNDDAAALEEAKRNLLARLAESENERHKEEEKRDARMNMRATLTMILTVAGEFYGQRDLLEFRGPFVGM